MDDKNSNSHREREKDQKYQNMRRRDDDSARDSHSNGQPREKTRRTEDNFQAPSTSCSRSQVEALRNPFHAASTQHLDENPNTSASLAGRGGKYNPNDPRQNRGRRGECFDLVVSRPNNFVKKGNSDCEKVQLTTNYFKILTRPEWVINQYHVEFSPEIEGIRFRRSLLGPHARNMGVFRFDGTSLFTPNILYDQDEAKHLILQTPNREGDQIQIIIKYVGFINYTDIQQLQVLNLVQRQAINQLGLQLVGRNYFDAHSKISIKQHNLEVWPGYDTSIRQHEKNILMCVDIPHKTMRTETVYNIFYKYRNNIDGFKKMIIGSTVLTDYNNKTYRVHDLDTTKTPSSTFSTKNGEISFVEYYKTRYNIPIKCPDQPLLLSRPKERRLRTGESDLVLLIPELCRTTGLTDEMVRNFRLMRDLADQTRLSPTLRIRRLEAFNNRIRNTPASNEVLRSWDMKIDNKLLEVEGRILGRNTISLGNNIPFRCNESPDWSNVLQTKPQYTSAIISRWTVIVPREHYSNIERFIRTIMKVATDMHMKIERPTFHEISNDRAYSYKEAIIKAVHSDQQILFVVLRKQDEERYNCIKRTCCVDYPIPSQVVTLRNTDGNKAMTVATKIAIQMNAKLKGSPWNLRLNVNNYMFIGYDLSTRKGTHKTYGAMVAAFYAGDFPKYFSHVSELGKNQNISTDIGMSLWNILKTIADTTEKKFWPKSIIFYRDGVGDGMLSAINEIEVECLKEKIKEIYTMNGLQEPKFAFIVVSKRVKTRLFAKEYNSMKNPVPGTVVDDIITLPERFDFYLISQKVTQGTVSPTNYNVLYSSLTIPPHEIQKLTYQMTHLYYNWASTCRVPAVCQYAHKLSSLVAENIHTIPSRNLSKQLFFL